MMKLPQRRFPGSMLASFCFLIIAASVMGQTFTTLHGFSGGTDGDRPYAEVVQAGDSLYGTTAFGGQLGYGTVFGINIGNAGLTNLHAFTWNQDPLNPDDGQNPFAGLTVLNDTLYGVAANGGKYANGMIFKVNLNGSNYTNLYNFSLASSSLSTNSDGINPQATLVVSGTSLYGTAYGGGALGNGTIFTLGIDGTGFRVLHSFTDGAGPGGLLLSGDTFYGTTDRGGSANQGTVFRMNIDGTGFQTLYDFSPTPTASPYTNNDGATPYSTLLLSGGILYGTASSGGTFGNGTLFALRTNGAEFTTLHSFSAFQTQTNPDGAQPQAGLALSGGNLYGTTLVGGNSGNGTVFELDIGGTHFTTLHSFGPMVSGTNSDGAGSRAALVVSSNFLYGTTYIGGPSKFGTLFSISLQQRLTITLSGPNVILRWPTNAEPLILQLTTNLSSPVWTPNSSTPVIINDQYTVTNLISATQQFFRLGQ